LSAGEPCIVRSCGSGNASPGARTTSKFTLSAAFAITSIEPTHHTGLGK
jgi:hypothetical protein